MCKVFNQCMFQKGAWHEMEWHEKVFPEILIRVLHKAGKDIVFFECSSKSEEDDFTMNLNKALCNLTNLKELRLTQCNLVYSWLFLKQTKHVTHMYVEECLADPNAMVSGLNALVELKHLQMTNCRLMTAYTICQAVRFCLKLQYLDVSGSGNMKSVLACVILNKCTSLSTFLFSNRYTYDTMYDRLRWYRIARMKFQKVTFPDVLYERVDFYARTDSAVRQLFNIAQMQKEICQREN